MTSTREDMHPVVLVLHTPLEVDEVAQALGARLLESRQYLNSTKRMLELYGASEPDPECCDRCKADHARRAERVVERDLLQQRHDIDQAVSRRLTRTEADFVDSEPSPDSQALMDFAVAAAALIDAQRFFDEHHGTGDSTIVLDAARKRFDRLVRHFADNKEN